MASSCVCGHAKTVHVLDVDGLCTEPLCDCAHYREQRDRGENPPTWWYSLTAFAAGINLLTGLDHIGEGHMVWGFLWLVFGLYLVGVNLTNLAAESHKQGNAEERG